MKLYLFFIWPYLYKWSLQNFTENFFTAFCSWFCSATPILAAPLLMLCTLMQIETTLPAFIVLCLVKDRVKAACYGIIISVGDIWIHSCCGCYLSFMLSVTIVDEFCSTYSHCEPLGRELSHIPRRPDQIVVLSSWCDDWGGSGVYTGRDCCHTKYLSPLLHPSYTLISPCSTLLVSSKSLLSQWTASKGLMRLKK